MQTLRHENSWSMVRFVVFDSVYSEEVDVYENRFKRFVADLKESPFIVSFHPLFFSPSLYFKIRYLFDSQHIPAIFMLFNNRQHMKDSMMDISPPSLHSLSLPPSPFPSPPTLRYLFDSKHIPTTCMLCNNKQHMKDSMVSIMLTEGEGIIMRKVKSTYEQGRSNTIVKLKVYLHFCWQSRFDFVNNKTTF